MLYKLLARRREETRAKRRFIRIDEERGERRRKIEEKEGGREGRKGRGGEGRGRDEHIGKAKNSLATREYYAQSCECTCQWSSFNSFIDPRINWDAVILTLVIASREIDPFERIIDRNR